jgi:hypothetical protein
MPDINYLAVLVAAIASMVIGSIWHGPLFGKKYMQVMGFDQMSPEQRAEMKKGMTKMYILQFIASLVMFYVLAGFIGKTGSLTLAGGLGVGFWAWLGFAVPIKMGEAIWGGKWPLFWIGIGNMLITLLATGAIIGAWR